MIKAAPIVTNQIITDFRELGKDMAREGKDTTCVTLGNLSRDESSTLCGTLNENDTIGHPCHV